MRHLETVRSIDGVKSAVSNLVELLRVRAAETPERTAYRFLGNGENESGRLTFSDLDRRARVIAVRLQERGLAGERVLLLYPPGLPYIEAFLGCLYAGVVAVPAHPPTRQHLPRHLAVMRDAAPAAIMATEKFAVKFRDTFAGHAPHLAQAWLTTDTSVPDRADAWRAPPLSPESLAFLQYTSGSTGDPKGVMISHGNLLANQEIMRQSFDHTERSTVVGWLPLYHDMGLIGNILQPLYVGSTAVLMSPMAFLEKPMRWLKAISEYRAATSGGPNFAYELCARKLTAEDKRDLDLSCWTLAFNGSEPVRLGTLQRFGEAFAECGFRRDSFFPCYGLAEATLFVAGARVNDRAAGQTPDHPSYGTAPAGHDIRIVHPETGAPCPEGREGEIRVAGPSVAQGYWNRPEESEQTFRARILGEGKNTFLRTGDLGFLLGGRLRVTGRIKDLIILRGRNFYPQDIEQALTDRLPSLRPGGCAAFPVAGDDEEGVAVVAEVTREVLRKRDFVPILRGMRRVLSEECELSAADLVLVKPGGVPKTSSGKIRRRACREAYLNGGLPVLACTGWPAVDAESEGVANPAPAPEHGILREALASLPPGQCVPLVTRFLRSRATHLLGIAETELPLDLSLRATGLDSIRLVEIKHAADELLGVETSLSLFFSDRSLAELGEALVDRLTEVIPPNIGWISEAHPPQPPGRLSCSQQSMWAVYRMESENRADNLHLALEIQGPVKPECLYRAFDRLIERHAALRTIYRSEGDTTIQAVLSLNSMPPYFTVVDAIDWSEDRLQADLGRRAWEPFDLGRGPILRATVYRYAEERVTLLLCAHHIAIDLWSLLIFLEELQSVYRALADNRPPRLAEPAAEYFDFIAWQRDYLESPECRSDWDYWRSRLGGELPLLALPTDRRRPKQASYAGASVPLRIDQTLTARLKALASSHGVSLFTLLLAAYKGLLYRYTGQHDLIVGVPTAGRGQARFTSVVGNFVNPVPLRTRPNGDKPFSDYLAEVHEALIGALAHQNFPFSQMVERLHIERSADHWPIHQTLFVLQQAQTGVDGKMAQLALGEEGSPIFRGAWRLRPVPLRERVENFDLKLMATVDEARMICSFQYRTDLFERGTIDRLASHYGRLLAEIAADPERSLGRLPLFSETEYGRILVEWNATEKDYSKVHGLHRLFEQQAARTPEALAVVSPDRQLSYRELNVRSNRLAHALIEGGVGRTRWSVSACHVLPNGSSACWRF